MGDIDGGGLKLIANGFSTPSQGSLSSIAQELIRRRAAHAIADGEVPILEAFVELMSDRHPHTCAAIVRMLEAHRAAGGR